MEIKSEEGGRKMACEVVRERKRCEGGDKRGGRREKKESYHLALRI